MYIYLYILSCEDFMHGLPKHLSLQMFVNQLLHTSFISLLQRISLFVLTT